MVDDLTEPWNALCTSSNDEFDAVKDDIDVDVMENIDYISKFTKRCHMCTYLRN